LRQGSKLIRLFIGGWNEWLQNSVLRYLLFDEFFIGLKISLFRKTKISLWKLFFGEGSLSVIC